MDNKKVKINNIVIVKEYQKNCSSDYMYVDNEEMDITELEGYIACKAEYFTEKELQKIKGECEDLTRKKTYNIYGYSDSIVEKMYKHGDKLSVVAGIAKWKHYNNTGEFFNQIVKTKLR